MEMDMKTFKNITEGFNHPDPNEWKNRISSIANRFHFLGYKWELYKDEPLANSKTSRILSYTLTNVSDDAIDILNDSVLLSKTSVVRCILEATFSMFYDITIINITVALMTGTEVRVGFEYINGSKLFESVQYKFDHSCDSFVTPMLKEHDDFSDTTFPVLSSKLYANTKFQKGYQYKEILFNPTGRPVSDNFPENFFNTGYHIHNLILTDDEYNELMDVSTEEAIPLVTDAPLIYRMKLSDVTGPVLTANDGLAKVLGAGSVAIGTILMYLPLLNDVDSLLVSWDFTKTEENMPVSYESRYQVGNFTDNPDIFVIRIQTRARGIIIDGKECLTKISVDDNKNHADLTIKFVNGYDNERLHNIVVSDGGIFPAFSVFHNIFTESVTEYWSSFDPKRASQFDFKPHGIICFSCDADSKIVEHSNCTAIEASIDFVPIYLALNKPEAAFMRALRFSKLFWDNRIRYCNIYYPIKIHPDVIVYKSIARNEHHRYNYASLLFTRKYDTYISPLSFIANTVEEVAPMTKGLDSLTDPRNNPLVQSLMTSLTDCKIPNPTFHEVSAHVQLLISADIVK